MKVGDGNVKIKDIDTVYDMIYYVNSLMNSSAYIALKKTDEILLLKGTSRTVSEEYIEQTENLGIPSIISEIKSESLMKKMLSTISNMVSYNTKISLIILFISNGLGTRFPNIFKLDENLKSPDLQADNKKINKLICEFFERNYKDTEYIINKFNEKICKHYPKEVAEAIQKMGSRIYQEQQVSNLFSNFLYIIKDTEVYKKVHDDILFYRQEISQYTHPLIYNLIIEFGIPHSTHKVNKNI